MAYTFTYNAPGDNYLLSRDSGTLLDYFTEEDLQGAVINEPTLVLGQDKLRRVELDANNCTNIVGTVARTLLDALLGLGASARAATSVTGSTFTAFGALRVSEATPKTKMMFVSGINDAQKIDVYTEATGAISFADARADLTVAAVNDYITMDSRDRVPYVPGQGSIFRFTAAFPNTMTGSRALMGAGTATSGLFFGYNNTAETFGIMQRSAGKVHIHQFTVTAAAVGVETITVTLDGTGHTFSATNAGGSIPFTAWEVGINRAVGDWTVQHTGAVLTFTSKRPGLRSGAYSFSSTGAATGTNAQVQAGAANTETFVAEADWNGTALTGQVYKERGNTFEIVMNWGGYGNILFRIMSATTGQMVTVHSILTAGTQALPFFDQPHLRLRAEMNMDSGPTVPAPVLSVTSACAYMDGKPYTHGAFHTTNMARLALNPGVEEAMVSMRVRDSFNSLKLEQEATMKNVDFSTDGATAVVVRLILNPLLGARGPTSTTDFPQWSAVSSSSYVDVDTSAVTFSGGEVIRTYTQANNRQTTIPLPYTLQPGDILLCSAESIGANNEQHVVFNWYE
jgi:hypothetical protein